MSERAKAAYAAYGEVVEWKNFRGDPMPQFNELPEPIQRAWDSACEGALRHWMDNEFKTALSDDKRVEEKAGWMLKIGSDTGDSAIEAIRRAVASFVIDVIAPKTLPPSA